MKQVEIEYFWPLTEQIDLDLDFNGCYNRPPLFEIRPNDTKTVMSINSNYITLDVDYVNVKVSKKPNIFTRGIYKLIGLKWEVK